MTSNRALKPVRRRTAVRSGIARPLAVLAAVQAGLSAGGMVAIGWVLVPFWRGTSPGDFRRWFTTHSDRIRRLMGPLGGGATVLTAASAAVQLSEGRRPAATSLTAAAATAGVVAITLAVNEPANSRFTGGTLTDAETEELLRRWDSWHRVRVALGVLATVAATVAVTRTEGAGRGPRA
jgi:hypothetical protein